MNDAFSSGITDIGNLPVVGGVQDSSLNSPLPALSAALALDLAVQSDTAENLCKKYDLTLRQFQSIISHPAFIKVVEDMQQEIGDRGVTFKMKAAVQADMYLEDLHKMIRDTMTPPNIRLGAIQSIVKWAGLEPKQTAGTGETIAPFKLTINMPSVSAPVVVEASQE